MTILRLLLREVCAGQEARRMAVVGTRGSRLAGVWGWWAAVPAGLSPGERRFHAAGAAGIPQGWLAHFLYIFLFAYWGVWPLAVFNVLSVVLWTVIVVLWRQRRQNLMYALIAGEVMVHGALVMVYVGWGFGVQYYLFLLLLVGFLLPWPRRVNLSVTALNTALFIGFYYYSELVPPLAVVPPVQLAVVNVINIVSAFGISAAITMYFISIAERAEAELEAEHARSEALLNNVLPTPIATRLKAAEGRIAEGFPQASILFADIAGFTPFSQQISPEELVGVLDAIFSRFDELVDRFGLEKIKTVGDAYMVAAGIPTPRADHAEALARFALAMRAALDEFNREAGVDLRLRIGMNSGPVVAGVIGRRRFLYDLWGDSVNTASRMESHGQPGEIQVTEATRLLLDGKFRLEERGLIEVKGKGVMRTYFLRGAAGGGAAGARTPGARTPGAQAPG